MVPRARIRDCVCAPARLHLCQEQKLHRGTSTSISVGVGVVQDRARHVSEENLCALWLQTGPGSVIMARQLAIGDEEEALRRRGRGRRRRGVGGGGGIEA